MGEDKSERRRGGGKEIGKNGTENGMGINMNC